MSSSQNIEHVILFKVKDNVQPSEVNAIVNRIKSLDSIDEVLHITAAPLLRVRSSNPSLAFTLVSHSRYKSKEELGAYAVHPTHLSVIKENSDLIDDILAVDWFTDEFGAHVTVPPGSGVRVTFWKLKEGLGEQAKSEILEGIKGIKEKLGGVTQFNHGENFSARAKGFSIAFLAVFPSQSELDAVESNHDEKFKDYLHDSFELDFVVPLQ